MQQNIDQENICMYIYTYLIWFFDLVIWGSEFSRATFWSNEALEIERGDGGGCSSGISVALVVVVVGVGVVEFWSKRA